MKKPPIPKRTEYSPQIKQLPSGLTVVVDYVPTVASTALGVWVNVGSRDEPVGQEGIAHFIEHASFRRTKNRSTKKIARDFENVGAYANAYTTKEETCYYVRTLSDHLPSVTRTLADIIVNPLFDADDLKRERTIIAEEIRSYEDEAEELIFDLAEQELFGSHPLGTPIVGTAQSVSKLSRYKTRTFHKQHYHAGSIVVTASGSSKPDEVFDLVEQHFAALHKKQPLLKRKKPPRKPPTQQTINKMVQQAHVCWSVRTQGYNSKHRNALAILNVVLGDGMASRLNMRLRETHGIAYTASSQLQLFTDVGMLSVYAAVDPDQTQRCESIFDKELSLLARNGITPSERKRAIEQLRANKIMGLESLTARMSLIGKGMLDDGVPEDPFATIDELLATSLDEVNDLARSMFNPDGWSRIRLIPGTQ